jgi:Ca2+-transporting ATPase
MTWHAENIDNVLAYLKTDLNGLTEGEAEKRLNVIGLNELTEQKQKKIIQLIGHQFADFMILLLISAAIICGFLGDLTDTLVIVIIVVLNAMLGFVQEYRAEKAMQALKKLASPSSLVTRSGKVFSIQSTRIVPGDIIQIETGNIVPADIRLIEAFNLKANEASLTGESFPSEKQSNSLPNSVELTLGDLSNMLFKGTSISHGRGIGVVVETGMKTQLGKIASLLEQDETKTPLQKRLIVFGKKLSYFILSICTAIFIIGIIRNEDPLLMLLTVISLAVAAIPEALPAVITIALALGAKRMATQNALIRNLPAVETLGSVTYICTDKTGTITANKMRVEKIVFNETTKAIEDLTQADKEKLESLLTAMAISNDVQDESVGDPTEIALWQVAKELGFDKNNLLKEFTRIGEIPFDSVRKCMTTVHKKNNSTYLIITKGAVETLSNRDQSKSAHYYQEAAAQLANDGLRVIGFSVKYMSSLPEQLTTETIENNLTLIGLAGLADPPRKEIKESIEECKAAGINPVIITGDHILTAKYVGVKVTVLKEGDLALTGSELSQLNDNDFEKIARHVKIYARVSPEQKLRIVKTLQDSGEFVAMTGDGVNDAPSLKRADIGIAMGLTGTDVSREASDLILLDDNFSTIVKAVKQGRRIYDNIRKFIKYALTCNSAEVWTIFLAPLVGLPIPLLPIHILWINLVTDGLPGIALTAEPAEKDIMKKKPRNPTESIFSEGLGIHIIWVGLLMAIIAIGTQAFAINSSDMHWQTMVFTVLSFSQMGHVLAIRSDRQSLFTHGLFTNLPLLSAVSLTFVLQLLTIYTPALNSIFKTQPLTFLELTLSIGLSSLIFIAVEIEKWLKGKAIKTKIS